MIVQFFKEVFDYILIEFSNPSHDQPLVKWTRSLILILPMSMVIWSNKFYCFQKKKKKKSLWLEHKMHF